MTQGTWVDVAVGTPLADAGNGRGVAWGDYDNDGDLDLYLANSGQANKLFRNEGGDVFSEVAGGTQLADTGAGQGVAWGDADNDGDLDLYLANQGQPNRLFRNDAAAGQHWLQVRARGDRVQSRRHRGPGPGGGGRSQPDPRHLRRLGFLLTGRDGRLVRAGRGDDGGFAHRALAKRSGAAGASGAGRGPDAPGGGRRRLFRMLPPERRWATPGAVGPWRGATTTTTATSTSTWPTTARRTSCSATTAAERSLMPRAARWATPGYGRGVAWGDYDNDGDLDLYLANDGQANKLFRNDGGGAFVDVTGGPAGRHRLRLRRGVGRLRQRR